MNFDPTKDRVEFKYDGHLVRMYINGTLAQTIPKGEFAGFLGAIKSLCDNGQMDKLRKTDPYTMRDAIKAEEERIKSE